MADEAPAPSMIKAPRHPAEDALDFWRREAELQRANLDLARRENISLEHHYCLALVEIRRLQDALIAAHSQPALAHGRHSDTQALLRLEAENADQRDYIRNLQAAMGVKVDV